MFAILFVDFFFFSYFFFKIFKELSFRLNYGYFLESFKIGIPITLSSITYITFSSLDITLLDKFASIEVVAQYTLILSFISIIPMIMASFQSIFSPQIFKEKSPKINFIRINSVVNYSVLFTIILCIILSILIFVSFQLSFLDHKYSNLNFVIVLLVCGASAHALTHLYKLLYTQLILNYVSLFINFFVSFLAILLYPFLIKNYGIIGAAVGNFMIGILVLFLHLIIISIYFKRFYNESNFISKY
jgi:O-antigen/teichoic acid export membrane protein